MARARIIRRQDRCFIELPKEFMSSDEAELFALRDGYYLLSIPLTAMAQNPDNRPSGREMQDAGLNPEEASVIHKLQAIKFGERSLANVQKALSDPEKEILKVLEKKRFVNLFKGDKYKEGVYNIDDRVYTHLKKPNEQKPNEAAADPARQALSKQGFMVIKDQREARELSERLKGEMKAGTIVGTKGFDGSFYVVTRDYFGKASKTILAALEKEADVPTIASACNLDADGVRAVLLHLAESGEVIEKRKGTYAAV